MIRLSRIFLVVLAIPTLLLIYFLFNDQGRDYSFLLIPLGVLLAVTFVLQHQIDSWWIRRSDQALDSELKSILNSRFHGFNRTFSGNPYTEKDLIVFTHDCEFIGKGLESVPDDIKHLIASHAFYFGNHTHTKWPGHYNRIALYSHPFISPQYQDQVHSVECHKQDGVIIFSMEQLLSGLNQPGQFYNIAVHGFADAFFNLYPINIALEDEVIWKRLRDNLQIDPTEIRAIVGLEDFSALIPLAHYFIFFPKKTARAFPECQALFDVINAE